MQRSAELRSAVPEDSYVRWAFPVDSEVDGWRLDRSVAWFRTSPKRGVGWLTAVGPEDEVARLLEAARDHHGDELAGATLPRAVVERSDGALVAMRQYNLWDWFVTSTQPPVRAGEEQVRWAVPRDEPAIAELLDTASPRHSARPGDDEVVRWCVLRDPAGALLAAAAHTEHARGVPHLASIVTRTDQRGRGLGAAVTAWLTRRILADGFEVVTLGMYADNEVARRMYRALGYTDTHCFASGWLA